jgi:hypothetical protein
MMIAALCSLAACTTTHHTPPPATDSLAVIILPANGVQIVHTLAWKEGEQVVVNGQIQRKKTHRRSIPKGHIDVSLIDQHGKTILQIPTKLTPEIIPRMHGAQSSFSARMPVVAPEGSFVCVKFHSGPHDS